MSDPDAAGPVRVRIAPSPTGYFHVGNARTALFNWLFARQQGGRFIWRVEDTDRARYVEGSLDDQRESLDWLGISPDEGPFGGGDFGPYLQSERQALYHENAQALLEAGHAYKCFCTPERLDLVRQQRAAAGLKVGYDRHCRNLSLEEVAAREAAGEQAVMRLKMPLTDELVLHDIVRGDIHFAAAEFEDVVMMKRDGFPTYHVAVVIDDHLMKISHVLRADEWIPSAPIQIFLYQCLGWPEPTWAHVPMVLNPNGKGKLSKRKTVDADGNPIEQMVQVREYRAAGYLPEAMVNYLALLGWAYSADEEVFTLDEAVARFRIEDIKTSPAAWNPEKLTWMNGVYIRALPSDELARRLLPFIRDAGFDATLDEVSRIAPLVQERISTLKEAVGIVDCFWVTMVSPSREDLIPKKLDAPATARVLEAAGTALETVDGDDWTHDHLEAALRGVAASLGLGAGPAFQPIRVAVTGKKVSPPLFETLEILGKEKTLARLESAAKILQRPAE